MFQSVERAWRDDRPFQALKAAVCLATLSTIAIAPKLWLSVRAFPTVPAVDGLANLPQWVAFGLTLLLVGSVIGLAVIPRPGKLAWLPVGLLAVLVLFDINRLQPSLYEYAPLLLGIGLARRQEGDGKAPNRVWGVCSFAVIAVYFWSGLQKANVTFSHEVFPFLMKPLGPFGERLLPLWPIVPIVETLGALLLAFPRSRRCGVILIVAMHAFNLFVLGPFGQNFDSIVWPWNFWMAVLIPLLFWSDNRPLIATSRSSTVGRAVLILFGLMPALNFVGCWDGFLSFSYYSGRIREAYIYLTPMGLSQLPARYRENNPALAEDSPGRYRLDIARWAYDKLNAPPYLEPRVYQSLVQKLEQEEFPPNQMTLIVRDANPINKYRRTYSQVDVR